MGVGFTGVSNASKLGERLAETIPGFDVRLVELDESSILVRGLFP